MTTSFDHRGKGHRSPMGRRRAAAASVLAAVGLHLAALGAVGVVVTQWRTGGTSSTLQHGVASVFIVPQAAAGTAPEPSQAATSVVPPSEVRARDRPPPPPVPARPAAPAAAAPIDPANAIRYYRVGEVDRPAVPESDWNLDTAALDAAGLNRLVFEVFIDTTGAIVACTILEPTTLAEEVRRSLEGRLQHTVLQPALRDGTAVPSVRKIEMSVLPGLE